MRARTLRKTSAAIAGSAALAVLGAGAASGDETPTPDPERTIASVPPDVQPRAKAHVVADKIKALAEYKENGYAGLKTDAANDRIDLWWRGEVTPDVQEVIDRSREEEGVTTTVRAAERSRAEMRRLGELFHRNAELKDLDIEIFAVTAPPDQAGFNVAALRGKAKDSKAETEKIKKIKEKGQEITGVPILSVALKDKNPEVATSRQDDFPPWWGGARMISVRYNTAGDRSRCSTGFAVTYGQPGDDQARMLSAAHCALNLTSSTSGFHNIGWWDGTIEASPSVQDALAHTGDQLVRRTYDSLLLNTAGSTEAAIYVGTITANGGNFVAGSIANNNEEADVYISGANSGSRGPLYIENDNYDRQCPDHNEDWCPDGIIAQWGANGTATVAGVPGDSGGPVFSYIANSTRVNARGIIAGTLENDPYNPNDAANAWVVACPTLVWTGQTCTSRVTYTPIRAIINHWGNIVLKTGFP